MDKYSHISLVFLVSHEKLQIMFNICYLCNIRHFIWIKWSFLTMFLEKVFGHCVSKMLLLLSCLKSYSNTGGPDLCKKVLFYFNVVSKRNISEHAHRHVFFLSSFLSFSFSFFLYFFYFSNFSLSFSSYILSVFNFPFVVFNSVFLCQF
jgi:hypothetical protein